MTHKLSINPRSYFHHLPVDSELSFDKTKNYLFELPCLRALTINGEKADTFLQGQLSCDIREINSTQMRQGLLCNLKGRILALLDVLNWQGYQLILPHDLLYIAQNALNKAAALSRVMLEVNPRYQLFGFYLNNRDNLLPDFLMPSEEPLSLKQSQAGISYTLGHGLYIFLMDSSEVKQLKKELFKEAQQLRGDLAWHYLLLKNKYLSVYPETSGLFLPHRLGLHLTGYLSFNKGCYKGQEIIARTHYKASLKHALFLYLVKTDALLHPGMKLLDTSGNTLGELIDLSPLGSNNYLIAASLLLEHPKEFWIEGYSNSVELFDPKDGS